MNSREEDFALRRSASGQPDDTRRKPSLTTRNDDSVSDRRPDSETGPVRINREGAQNNIPPDPDPDDPVAP